MEREEEDNGRGEVNEVRKERRRRTMEEEKNNKGE